MQMAIFGVLLALLAVQQRATVLSLGGCAALLAAAAMLAIGYRRVSSRRGRAFACLALGIAVGFAYGSARAHWRLADQLDPALDGVTLSLAGQVRGLVQHRADGVRFAFVPDAGVAGVPRRIAVSWYPDAAAPIPALAPGQPVVLELRLKRVRSQRNPGGFDYAGHLFAEGVGALGYARTVERLAAPPATDLAARIDRWRDDIRRRIAVLVPPDAVGVLTAMAVGDQGGISDTQWTILRNTGTAHLVAISGLHVSIVAALLGGLWGWLWRRFPAAVLWLPAQRASVVAAALAAVVYGALAGFGVPVTRSLLMLLIVCAAWMSARRPTPGRVLMLALLGVMLFDPWCVLAAGFWLSFGAVAALLLVLSGRHGVRGRVGAFAVAQLSVTCLTAPVLLVLFGQMSLVSPLANALAIPLVSLVVVPLVLAGAVLPIDGLLLLAALVMGVLMDMLAWAAAWPWSVWTRATPPVALVVLALAGSAWALLPRGTPWRTLGWLAWLPALLWLPARPAPGTFEARVLDVGQGLAVHVRTASRDMLYDSGPSYYRGGDAGARHVLPYLQGLGLRQLDLMVISHDDKDHAGGARSVLAGIDVQATIAGEGVRLETPVPGRPCHAGEGWTWDGVTFRFLHPASGEAYRKDNDRSCVLHISTQSGALLLPGDIESRIEQHLAEQGRWPPSSVVVAPHHGSRSSSSDALVDAAGARAVVFSSAHGNAFGHPAAAVVARWQAAGAEVWRTDTQGAVWLRIDSSGVRLGAEAAENLRYWHPQQLSAAAADARLETASPAE
ncbi:DNA internalization-related competence protein ComEC/Rec2 [Denitromonas iodatirespirans]|uniref:DNA internalization-related competence protein ComEC/Rec2 n=1 Tax=Denitromonas iodatirespirans TaxID=2795389 RepID=A0A944DIB7_DENI1|nr:DNA internalization-related competence protein ComEC/Rec2 [Denitromonas iodatirespirans]MBT0963408.1 DNA internalization-related competence protein ComEC/Rec2 [Denitromonas iodatirespirans]